MRIVKQLIVPVFCMAAITVFGQGSANVGKTVEELRKSVSVGLVSVSDYRDDKNQKMSLIKAASTQDKDLGFDGAMRFTLELTGDTGEVWYGQIVKPQGKRRADYLGEDTWEFRIPHGALKYPSVAYAMEYGYQMTNKTFVVVDQKCKNCESGGEIMERNKDSKNKLNITSRARAEHENAAGAGAAGDE
jgi:hypothetical protein